jgi:hypothetical protein
MGDLGQIVNLDYTIRDRDAVKYAVERSNVVVGMGQGVSEGQRGVGQRVSEGERRGFFPASAWNGCPVPGETERTSCLLLLTLTPVLEPPSFVCFFILLLRLLLLLLLK